MKIIIIVAVFFSMLVALMSVQNWHDLHRTPQQRVAEATARAVVDYHYRYDPRTRLCFATQGGGTSYAFATVPCSPEVLRLMGQ